MSSFFYFYLLFLLFLFHSSFISISSFFYFPMKTLDKLMMQLETFQFDEKAVEEYKNSFQSIIENESPETIEKLINENPDSYSILLPLQAGCLFMLHRFKDIHTLISPLDLSGIDRHLDYFNGKLIKYYYQSIKYLGLPIDHLYTLLVKNREYNNPYSVSVLVNSILDFQINNHIYQEIEEDITDNFERSRYCFYHGIICLVKGDYTKALSFFDESDILNKERELGLFLKKFIIVNKLLLSDYSIFYPYSKELSPYFSLIGAIKRAEVDVFYKLLEEHKEEYFKMNLYFIIGRLIQNLIQEGLRKITVCYSRILVKDINEILGINVDYLIHKTIKEGTIQGYVQDGVFYSMNLENLSPNFGEGIRKAVTTRNIIQGIMRYPEIVPLSYEKIFSGELKKENQ